MNEENHTCKVKVSVITPCFNAQSTLAQTIESVLSQTYTDWEMLIVDDCSSDSSAEIIKRYADKDGRIRYFKTPSKSGSPAMPRNIGIDNSKGDWLALLDADDVWLPNKLETQLKFIEQHDSKLVYSFYEKMDWQGNRNNRIIKTRLKTSYSDLLKSNSIPCLTSLVRKDVVGPRRFKNIPQEDFCFWLDILRDGDVAENVKEVLALYREAKDSRSANKLDMFKGYWNVIRNHQHLGLAHCCSCMLTYTIYGFLKYIK